MEHQSGLAWPVVPGGAVEYAPPSCCFGCRGVGVWETRWLPGVGWARAVSVVSGAPLCGGVGGFRGWGVVVRCWVLGQ